jgi:hypothetical protein
MRRRAGYRAVRDALAVSVRRVERFRIVHVSILPTAFARSWFLTAGWRRHRPIGPHETRAWTHEAAPRSDESTARAPSEFGRATMARSSRCDRS